MGRLKLRWTPLKWMPSWSWGRGQGIGLAAISLPVNMCRRRRINSLTESLLFSSTVTGEMLRFMLDLFQATRCITQQQSANKTNYKANSKPASCWALERRSRSHTGFVLHAQNSLLLTSASLVFTLSCPLTAGSWEPFPLETVHQASCTGKYGKVSEISMCGKVWKTQLSVVIRFHCCFDDRQAVRCPTLTDSKWTGLLMKWRSAASKRIYSSR